LALCSSSTAARGSSTPRCWDHAVADSFFSSLKQDRIEKQIDKNRELAFTDVTDYIDRFYNRTRRHSYLGRRQPRTIRGRAETT